MHSSSVSFVTFGFVAALLSLRIDIVAGSCAAGSYCTNAPTCDACTFCSEGEWKAGDNDRTWCDQCTQGKYGTGTGYTEDAQCAACQSG